MSDEEDAALEQMDAMPMSSTALYSEASSKQMRAKTKKNDALSTNLFKNSRGGTMSS